MEYIIFNQKILFVQMFFLTWFCFECVYMLLFFNWFLWKIWNYTYIFFDLLLLLLLFVLFLLIWYICLDCFGYFYLLCTMRLCLIVSSLNYLNIFTLIWNWRHTTSSFLYEGTILPDFTYTCALSILNVWYSDL